MPDTIRSKVDLVALLSDSQASHATNRQVLRDFVVSVLTLPNRLVTFLSTYLSNNAVFNVKDYLAVGDGIADDTSAIQAAIDAASLVGGEVKLPPGQYKTTLALIVSSGITLKGSRGNLTTTKGSVLLWGGGATGTVLSLFDVQDFSLRGIAIDGQSQPSVVGIDVQSDINPSSWNLTFEQFLIKSCNIGMRFGDGSAEHQVDHVRLSHFEISNISDTAIVVNSDNALDYSEINHGKFYNCVNYGIDMQRCGNVDISSCAAGGNGTMTFFHTAGDSNTFTIRNSQAEGIPSFLTVDGPGDSSTITLQGNTINVPVIINGFVRIIGIANEITSTISLLSGGSKWIGYGDMFRGAGTVTGIGSFINHRMSDATFLGVTVVKGEIIYNNGLADGGVLAQICMRTGLRGGVFIAGGAYNIGDWAVPTIDNGHIYQATIAGVAGAVDPAWPVGAGVTIVSGTVTFKEMGTACLLRDFGQTVSPSARVASDRGDADVTLTNFVDAPTQPFATALTANRSVSLSDTMAFAGSKFRIVRTGLGAFTLNVGALKLIPASTAAWVDVEFNGSQWVLTGYGTL